MFLFKSSFVYFVYLAVKIPPRLNKLFTIPHEDADLLVINKPAGLVCHPTKGDAYSSLISRARLYLNGAPACRGIAQRRPAPVLHSPCPPKLLPSEGWIGEAGAGPAPSNQPSTTLSSIALARRRINPLARRNPVKAAQPSTLNPQPSTIPSPHLVNRLDRETSGIVLIAKNSETAGELGKILEARAVQKEYLAIVHGHV